MDDILFQSGDIRDQVAKLSKIAKILDVFGPPNFFGEGPPKFLTYIYKLQSPPTMWQRLVTIGPETSEIKRREKKKEDRNSSGKAVKYNGLRPAIAERRP